MTDHRCGANGLIWQSDRVSSAAPASSAASAPPGARHRPHPNSAPQRRLTRRALGVFAVGLVLAACASSESPDTARTPDVAATPDTAAKPDARRAPSTTEIPSTTDELASTESTAASSTAPPIAALRTVSFGEDVLPVLEANCASCHTAGGPGASHMELSTAADAAEHAELIGIAVDIGYMPPWPAADGDLVFHDDRRLTDDQLHAVARWLANDGALDIDPATPIAVTGEPQVSIDRDRVLVGQPYRGSVADPDDYRCQIYDPELSAPTFVQGFGIEPDRTEVVHHALLFHARAESRQAAEAVDANAPGVGWPCAGLAGFGGRGQVNQIMSWAPGQAPTALPADTGIAIEPGDFFVTQIHYHYTPASADLAPDASTLVIDLASDEDIAAAGGALAPIDLTLYLGPAEIPCSVGETGPLCDRAAAIEHQRAQSDPLAGFVADGLLFQCGAKVEDFAAMTNGIASASCEHPARPGQIVSVWGHEHELGKSFRMILNPGTPDELVLLDIPDWDFDWQLNYSPVEEVILEAGDVIRVECSWDRSKIRAGAEPRYVFWSEGTDDEMCYSQIVTRPAPAG